MFILLFCICSNSTPVGPTFGHPIGSTVFHATIACETASARAGQGYPAGPTLQVVVARDDRGLPGRETVLPQGILLFVGQDSPSPDHYAFLRNFKGGRPFAVLFRDKSLFSELSVEAFRSRRNLRGRARLIEPYNGFSLYFGSFTAHRDYSFLYCLCQSPGRPSCGHLDRPLGLGAPLSSSGQRCGSPPYEAHSVIAL